MIVWVIAGLLGMATGLRIGWALVNKQSLVSTAMIVALGNLGVVAALNWQPLTLLIDTGLGWPNVSVGLSQVALIGCAAGSCVMITTVASGRSPVVTRRIAMAQYAVGAVIAAVSLASFFAAGRQPEMAPQEYLRRNLDGGGLSLTWLLPLLYVLMAGTLVAWAGVRHSNRSRRGRALFVFTVGIVLIVLATVFFLLRLPGNTGPVGVGAAITLLACAMVVVAAGSLLPSVEDWFGAQRELRAIGPLLEELGSRHPDIGIGVRPRGPLVFRVAERMSLISDALFLEATAAAAEQPSRSEAAGGLGLFGPLHADGLDDEVDSDDLTAPAVSPEEQAAVVAEWIYRGRGDAHAGSRQSFPGLRWLRQPETYSDREWILAIGEQYRDIDRRGLSVGA